MSDAVDPRALLASLSHEAASWVMWANTQGISDDYVVNTFSATIGELRWIASASARTPDTAKDERIAVLEGALNWIAGGLLGVRAPHRFREAREIARRALTNTGASA